MVVVTEDWGLCMLGYKESMHLNILSDTSLSFFRISLTTYLKLDIINLMC